MFSHEDCSCETFELLFFLSFFFVQNPFSVQLKVSQLAEKKKSYYINSCFVEKNHSKQLKTEGIYSAHKPSGWLGDFLVLARLTQSSVYILWVELVALLILAGLLHVSGALVAITRMTLPMWSLTFQQVNPGFLRGVAGFQMSEGTRTRPRFEMEDCHIHHTLLVKAGHKANTNSTSLFHFLMGGTSSDVVTRAGM